MDLKGKRIVGIAQIIFFMAMLVLYTRIGGMGMIYVAGSLELFFVITYLFLGGIPDTMDYMIRLRRKKDMLKDASRVWKAGVLYGIVATVFAELGIWFINEFFIAKTDLLYVDKLLELFMLSVPFLALMQVIRGIMQAELDRVTVSISRLVFVVCMVIGTVVSSLILGEYGAKAANLMQSVRLEHFYVVIGLIPGVIMGAFGASIFLVVMGLLHRRKVTIFDKQSGAARESILKLCLELFKDELPEVVVPCAKRIPVIMLLWLSLGEIASENYLFGNFYGAILPVFGVAWTLSDLGLTNYKKRLYIAYRKKAHEQFYRDLKTVLCYAVLHSMAICAFMFALHKSYLAIWDLQTFTSFMKLAMVSSIIGLLGLPCIVLEDVLKYRGMQSQVVLSQVAGVIASMIAGAVCAKFAGAGIVMYVVCISVQFMVATLFAAWSVSSVVGINYLTVFLRAGTGMIATAMIALLLYGVQRVLFTPLGGLATLLICILFGLVLQFIVILALHIFDRDEFNYLPFPFISKSITKFF